jgi:hypothetical protein
MHIASARQPLACGSLAQNPLRGFHPVVLGQEFRDPHSLFRQTHLSR